MVFFRLIEAVLPETVVGFPPSLLEPQDEAVTSRDSRSKNQAPAATSLVETVLCFLKAATIRPLLQICMNITAVISVVLLNKTTQVLLPPPGGYSCQQIHYISWQNVSDRFTGETWAAAIQSNMIKTIDNDENAIKSRNHFDFVTDTCQFRAWKRGWSNEQDPKVISKSNPLSCNRFPYDVHCD